MSGEFVKKLNNMTLAELEKPGGGKYCKTIKMHFFSYLINHCTPFVTFFLKYGNTKTHLFCIINATREYLVENWGCYAQMFTYMHCTRTKDKMLKLFIWTKAKRSTKFDKKKLYNTTQTVKRKVQTQT